MRIYTILLSFKISRDHKGKLRRQILENAVKQGIFRGCKGRRLSLQVELLRVSYRFGSGRGRQKRRCESNGVLLFHYSLFTFIPRPFFFTIPFYPPFFDRFCRIRSYENDKKWKNSQKMSIPTIAIIAKIW